MCVFVLQFMCLCLNWCVGVPVSSRVSSKIQQLVNTLKKPKRRPLREYFIDDFEELLEGTGAITKLCNMSRRMQSKLITTASHAPTLYAKVTSSKKVTHFSSASCIGVLRGALRNSSTRPKSQAEPHGGWRHYTSFRKIIMGFWAPGETIVLWCASRPRLKLATV